MSFKEMLLVAFPSLNKSKKSPQDIEDSKRRKTAMEWVPVVDIDKGIILLKNGMMVGMIKIHPVNIALYSKTERKRRVEILAKELNGITDNFEIFCIGRPVDLSGYLNWLSNRSKSETNIIRKRILRSMSTEATKVATSGEVSERRFYLCIYRKYLTTKSEDDFIPKLREWKDKLSGAELTTEFCDDTELINVCSLFSNPSISGIEVVNVYDMYDLPTAIND